MPKDKALLMKSPSRSPKKKDPPKEKRAKRYRSTCPLPLQERLQRAATQRLYLVDQSAVPEACKEEDSCVEFTVLGSTGNVYTVEFGLVPTCTCPDFLRREDMCKHIMFILLKVMGLSETNPLAYQKAYVSSELNELFAILRTRRVGGSILANDQVRAAVAASQGSGMASSMPASVQRRSLLEDSDCPICFDDLTKEPESTLTYCRGTCGANFHLVCLRRWFSAQTSSKCPHCRQSWVGDDDVTGNTLAQNETYANFGALQGQSPVRDTSTYRSDEYKKYRRYY